MTWEDIKLEYLRTIAKHYNTQVKIVGISKMKKPQLIEALKKHLDLDADSLGVKHKTDKKTFNWRNSANTDVMKTKPKPKAEKKPKAVAKKADIPVPPPTPKKAEDKSYKKKVVAKKVLQARGAVADAKAIKPPEPLPEYMSETTMMAPKGHKEKKAIEKKAIPQAKSAIDDAMAMRPPTTKKASVNSYPTLIDERFKEAEKILEKIKVEVAKIEEKKKTGYKVGVDNKKWNIIRDKLEKELKKIKKVGTDKSGNLYDKEGDKYFQDKYGDGWKLFHATAPKDKYWNVIVKLQDIYDKAQDLLNEKTIWG